MLPFPWKVLYLCHNDTPSRRRVAFSRGRSSANGFDLAFWWGSALKSSLLCGKLKKKADQDYGTKTTQCAFCGNIVCVSLLQTKSGCEGAVMALALKPQAVICVCSLDICTFQPINFSAKCMKLFLLLFLSLKKRKPKVYFRIFLKLEFRDQSTIYVFSSFFLSPVDRDRRLDFNISYWSFLQLRNN